MVDDTALALTPLALLTSLLISMFVCAVDIFSVTGLEALLYEWLPLLLLLLLLL